MTVFEATNKLLVFFLKNTCFELGTHFTEVQLVSDTDGDKAAILIALEKLNEQQFVAKHRYEEKTYWVLVKPLNFQEQQVPVSVDLGLEIANILNNLEPKAERCNPLNVTEEDVGALVAYLKSLLNSGENNGND